MLSRNVRLTRLARCVDLLKRRNVLDELGYTYWEAAPGASPSSGPLDPSVGFLTHPLERRIVGLKAEEMWTRQLLPFAFCGHFWPILFDALLSGTSTSGYVPPYKSLEPHPLCGDYLFSQVQIGWPSSAWSSECERFKSPLACRPLTVMKLANAKWVHQVGECSGLPGGYENKGWRECCVVCIVCYSYQTSSGSIVTLDMCF